MQYVKFKFYLAKLVLCDLKSMWAVGEKQEINLEWPLKNHANIMDIPFYNKAYLFRPLV